MDAQRQPRSRPDFLTKPTLDGELVTLRAVTDRDLPALRPMLEDREVGRLTGSQSDLPSDELLHAWYTTRIGQDDRLDLAVVERATGACVGEAVLNAWDRHNENCSFRIALVPSACGRGLGTEATRLICGYGFEKLGLHRVSLEGRPEQPRPA
jgi:RimJ/RimL family protein N-acetyltransferase